MRILVVEDDPKTGAYVRDGLGAADYDVHVVHDGRVGLERAAGDSFDLLIVDRMLPDIDGLSLVRSLRAQDVETPVLFLTAMSAISDRVAGFEGGGDDYLTKPFSMAELKARIGALGRRRPIAPSREATILRVGELELDRLDRSARRGPRLIELLPLQFKLLEFLMLNDGRLVTRSMLLERVWGFNFDPRTNIVETHISHLRAKIDAPGRPSLIKTVRGAGYVLRAA